MTNARHLWAVARALQRDVRPCVDDRAAHAVLENAIRVLTATANGLEQGPADFADRVGLAPVDADTDRLGGPAENAAAYRSTGAVIADIATRLDDGAKVAAFPEAIAAERALLAAAVARMDAIEREPRRRAATNRDAIDPERLAAYLRHVTGQAALRIESFAIIVGGRSRQTALVALSGVGDFPARLVLQRAIPNLAVDDAFLDEATQFRLLERLHRAGMRVPRPVLVETDPAWLDAPFTLVEEALGSTAQSDYWLPLADESIVLDLARQMAILHAQPVAETGLGLRRARASVDPASWKDELEELAREWAALARWPSVTMSAAIAYLRANVDCLDGREAIVHNDMIFHNVLAADGGITAVLDWEQCAIGHPGEDLGYCYPVVIATLDWGRFMAAYRAAGGADVSQRQIDYFALRAGLRLMNLVLKGGRDTFEKGQSDDMLVATAGAYFTQRLMNRIALVLQSILDRA